MSLNQVCVFRLSALGDVTHLLPVLNELRAGFPDLAVTWVLGKLEARLLEGLPGVRMIAIDKRQLRASWSFLRHELGDTRFDALLHMQIALRAGLLGSAIRARRRIGYPHSRSKELHSWFVNEHLPEMQGGHVLDQLLAFGRALGAPALDPTWELPIPPGAHDFAQEHLPGDQPTLIISPCSSHVLRNWTNAGYAAVAQHAIHRGWRVALVGGRSELERQTAAAITGLAGPGVIDLVGKDTLKQLLALLKRAHMVLTPDSGPAHFANAVGTPTIALHAATDPQRSGPYCFRHLAINAFPRAARQLLRRDAESLKWGTKIERPGVMELISTSEVIERFEEVRQSTALNLLPGQ